LLIKEQTCFGKYLHQSDLKNHFKHSQDILALNNENSVVISPIVEAVPQKIQRGRKNGSVHNKGKRRAEGTFRLEKKLPKKHLHGEKENPINISESSNSDSEQQLPVKQNKKSYRKTLAKTKGSVKLQQTSNKVSMKNIKEGHMALRSENRLKNQCGIRIAQNEEESTRKNYQEGNRKDHLKPEQQREKSFILNLFSDSPVVLVNDADRTNRIFERIRSNLMMPKMIKPFDLLVTSSDEDDELER